jgi:hypothetical protein
MSTFLAADIGHHLNEGLLFEGQAAGKIHMVLGTANQ